MPFLGTWVPLNRGVPCVSPPPQIRAQLQAQGVQPREVRLMRNKSSGEPGSLLVGGAGATQTPGSRFGVMGGMLGCLGSFLGAPTHLGLLGRGLGLPPPYSRRGAPRVLVLLPGAPRGAGPLPRVLCHTQGAPGGLVPTPGAPRGASHILRGTYSCCGRFRWHPGVAVLTSGASRGASTIRRSIQGCCAQLGGHPGMPVTSPGAPRGANPIPREHPGVLCETWGAPRGVCHLPRGTQGCQSCPYGAPRGAAPDLGGT